jgi:tetratricopeptide (TPR) repeat protein
MKALTCSTILAGLLTCGSVLAAADSAPADPKDPVLEKAAAATARKDWAAAQGVLAPAVAANPDNANYHNLYAYSIRKGASPDMSLVFKHYNEALRIDPKHRGAHEYIGEAYLMIGNVAKAKEHLGQLDKLCFFSCTEYTELKKAIAEHEKTGKR